MSSPAARERWRGKRTEQVQKFCTDHGMSLNPLNNGYQLRVENLVDFYPTNGRYCILQTGERGDFDTFSDMKRIMLRAIPTPHIQKREGFKSIGVQPNEFNVLHDVRTMTEAEYMKWYRRLWRWLRRVK